MRAYWVLLLIGVLAALLQFQERSWKPLEVFDSDPGGYYVYLPSAFIYHYLARADSLALLHEVYKPGKAFNMGLVAVPGSAGTNLVSTRSALPWSIYYGLWGPTFMLDGLVMPKMVAPGPIM